MRNDFRPTFHPCRFQLTAFFVSVALQSTAMSAQEPLSQADCVPMPGPVTDQPYSLRPILPGGIVVPLYEATSSKLKKERLNEAEVYNMTKGVPGRIQSIVNIHNPSIEVHTVDELL